MVQPSDLSGEAMAVVTALASTKVPVPLQDGVKGREHVSDKLPDKSDGERATK